MDQLLEAILDDDCHKAKGLLTKDRTLANARVTRPALYRSKIHHWLYAGDTALHLAAAGYRVQIARVLLEAGADPNAGANHRRSRPLHYAADGHGENPTWDPQRQIETIRCLLEAGAELDAQDKNGATALHRAVRTRCALAVRYLLKAGSDPRIRNLPGSTPFHLAVQNTGRGGSGAPKAVAAQRQIIAEFLSFGLSPHLKSASGKSVLDWARSAWIREMLSSNSSP